MVLTEKMLDSEANWLLQVDTDIEFPPTLMETMLDLAGEDKKILAASVPLGLAYPTCGFMQTEQPGIFEALPLVPMEPIEVDAIATACVLIHRSVFEEIADRHGKCWFHTIYMAKSAEGTPGRDFAFTGNQEDIAFSIRAKALGFKVWCVHVPGLVHYKTMPLTHDTEKSKQMATEMPGMGVLVQEN
jgi:GT2 family glycosyltransferase